MEALEERRLETINEVARIAAQDLELRPMMQRITDALAQKFGWEFVALVTLDADRTAFVCEAVTSAVPTEITAGYSRELGSGVVGEVVAILNLESTRRAAFHDQLPLLTTVAEQIAGAIANARLFEETRRRAALMEMMS